jgi:hypothetical protein
MKTYVFTVRGSGSFPLDMLRYDKCWPVSGESVNNMDSSSMGIARTVWLASTRHPTNERWTSFDWNCQLIRIEGK